MKTGGTKSIFFVVGLLIVLIIIIFFAAVTSGTFGTESFDSPKPKVTESTGVLAVSAPEEKVLPETIDLNVPFTAQAPFGNWADARQDYGCEEASILMAVFWARGENLTKEVALKEIVAMSDFEKENYGDFHDTSIPDTVKVMEAYFGKEGNPYRVSYRYDIGVDDIKAELAAGNVVIVPIDGTIVGNKYYLPPGPFRHQIVVRGYDDGTEEFITNDPGTTHGEGYRYGYKILENALMDYPTGRNEPVIEKRSAMIVVEK